MSTNMFHPSSLSYRLRCYACGNAPPDRFLPRCDCGTPSLVASVYPEQSSPTKYPEPVASDRYPGPVTPTGYPEPSSPTRYPEPSSPTRYPEPSSPTRYPEPSSPTRYPELSSPTAYPEPSSPTSQIYPYLVDRSREDIWKFVNWLPVRNAPTNLPPEKQARQTAVFSSPELSRLTGIPGLHFAFTGYWPERGAYAGSCSFKELEAHPTLQRAREFGIRGLIIASAGNTARAFLQNACHYGIRIVAVVPETSLEHLWIPAGPGFCEYAEFAGQPTNPVRIIAVRGDYYDAITLAGRLGFLEGFCPEGGAMNIARRDGMGTVMLEYAARTGRIPHHYVQAVGSGTGAIAALEAARRLRHLGSFGGHLPGLHLVQNVPFTPMADAWAAGAEEIAVRGACESGNETAPDLYASMLSNRHPPYSVRGGVFDCLSISGGEMYAVETEAAKEAGRVFAEIEGIDLAPEAEVALAAVLALADPGTAADRDGCRGVRTARGRGIPGEMLVNLTGGGTRRLAEDTGLIRLKPDIVISDPCIGDDELQALFK